MTVVSKRASILRDYAVLTKLPISAASALSAAAGYLAFSRAFGWAMLPALGGTLLLAMGASTLNEVQERSSDALMERTRKRPLPQGRMRLPEALALAVLLLALGLALLLWHHGWIPALLGGLAVFWYNGVYTPLKRHSAFAVIPGALIGALPPAMGWSAAGGLPWDPAILALCFVLFLWQVPHFWLLLMLHGEEYQRAGYPTLGQRFNSRQIARLCFVWTAGAATSCAFLVLFGTLHSRSGFVLLALGAFWLLGRSLLLLMKAEPATPRKAFRDTNLFALVLLLALIVDALTTKTSL